MIRKTLTVLSLVGLVLSVGLWGVSYFHVIITPNKGYAINFRTGSFRWMQQRSEGAMFGRPETIEKAEHVSSTEALRIFEREIPGFRVFISDRLGLGIASGGWEGFRTYWKPFVYAGYPSEAKWSYYYFPTRAVLSGDFIIFIPLWMPTLLFGSIFCMCRPLRHHRRRKRKRLGLGLKCGYDLRGSEERCPECGRTL